MKTNTYCILDLNHFGTNKHAVYNCDGTWVRCSGTENPILFTSVEAAEIYTSKVMGQSPTKFHPCRWS